MNNFMLQEQVDSSSDESGGSEYAVDEFTKDFQMFESDINHSGEQKVKKSLNKYMIFVDSKDRRFIEEESTFSFPIMINNSDYAASLSDSNLKNIKKIELIEVAIPNFYIDLKEGLFLDYKDVITSNKTNTNSNNLRLQRLIDLNYLHLEIDSFHNYRSIGTNNSFKKKSFVLRLDEVEKKDNINSGYYILNGNRYVEIGNINNSLVAGIDKNILSYRPHGEKSITIADSDIKLQNMTLSIFKSDNNKLSFLNDNLTISSVNMVSGNIKILLKMTKMFSSEEYPIGDIISIKPNTVVFNNDHLTNFTSLKSFLERTEGHSIISHYGASEGTPITDTKLFTGIYITTKFTYKNDIGTSTADIFTYHDFSLVLDNEYTTNISNIESNKLINLKNQILITLKITTEQYTL
jgi:hypothetical protein